MKYYKKCADGMYRVMEYVPRALSRREQIQEWVEADLLPILHIHSPVALEDTIKDYLSVSDEIIEECIQDHLNWKKGKHKTPENLKRGDIQVHPNCPKEQYISPNGYRLGDVVLVKSGATRTLDRLRHNGSYEQSGIMTNANHIITEDDIIEVVTPAPVWEVGDLVQFKNPFNNDVCTAPVEAFVTNTADLVVRVTQNGRKIPVTVSCRNTKLQELKSA